LLQVGQAYELLGTALGTWDGTKTVVVVGDFNSAPVDAIPVPPYPATLPWAPSLPVLPPYQVFMGGGFTDAWTLRPLAEDGLSCCQAEDLANRQSALYERIDLIFSLTRPFHVLDMKLLGNTMGDKTRPPGNGGLWPSDHAAVAAKLKFD
jgi:endonuclease/exonuclease/phosphatase family metal-dependent hydrolase